MNETPDKLKFVCSLIVDLMEQYSEHVVENGTMSFRFDCNDYHYECEVERTLKEDDKNEKTNN